MEKFVTRPTLFITDVEYAFTFTVNETDPYLVSVSENVNQSCTIGQLLEIAPAIVIDENFANKKYNQKSQDDGLFNPFSVKWNRIYIACNEEDMDMALQKGGFMGVKYFFKEVDPDSLVSMWPHYHLTYSSKS
jgi:hypothetical protein